MEEEKNEKLARVRELVGQGTALLAEENWEAAEKTFRDALVINSETMDVYTGILLAQYKRKRPEDMETVEEDYSKSWAYVKVFRYATQGDKDYFQAIEDANKYYRAGLLAQTGEVKKLYEAQDMFASLKKFRDSRVRAAECSAEIRERTGRSPFTKKKRRLIVGIAAGIAVAAAVTMLIYRTVTDAAYAAAAEAALCGEVFSGETEADGVGTEYSIAFYEDGTARWTEKTVDAGPSGDEVKSFRAGTYTSYKVERTLFGNLYVNLFKSRYKLTEDENGAPDTIVGYGDEKVDLRASGAAGE